ncbi:MULTISPECIES: GNAT family N-acetyltransferase [unclassified Microbacterium]|uniref:GNAT family N-acetyltransferase n=1 Tax=unclassified Microbacterium TaxID=2609290 RepID=UPI002468A8B3|nr:MULTISPECIES: GNAT family N-acetyltransferase [unclassified Microbacterium]MDH5134405.1 GNAT family N-acetyltransferase [Microbacterium sp. RD10]MDH5136770.1 GNAT family N-acetyltransferase [Microbacterium sp. RD11]MDH5145668.1 GNAT family N-acetyltransferase [Microbacterium sp. RD12]MDH5155183.1 GNAT family N-acetyltransferase [Microbacterium sp. RD06]MDH5166699.1 GNAT family N-acetyltransferase [Microbacterium sp. RD02]
MSRLLKIYRNRNYVWPDDVHPPARTAELRPITFDNVSQVERLRNASVAAAFRRFLDSGRFGVFAMVDGIVAGHAWVTPPADDPQVVNTYAKVAAGESLVHYCYVAPEQRGRGLYAQMLHETTAWAREHGATRVTVDTSVDNTASQKGIQRAGFTEVEPTTSVVIGRRLFYIRRGDRPA